MGLIPGRRKSNFFEKIILIVGLGIIFLGVHVINKVYHTGGFVDLWGLVQSIFLWLMLILLVVLLATEEDVKEEIAIIMHQQIEEVRLINEEIKILKQQNIDAKEISQNQLIEQKLLRKELESHKYKL